MEKKRKLSVAAFLLGIVITFGILGGHTLFQEGNPLPLLVSIMKLELSDNDYAQFSETPEQKRYVTTSEAANGYDAIKKFMKTKGWLYRDQMGAGLVFEKKGKEVVIETRQYSKRYILWNVPAKGVN